jgi:hypothetical protein
VQGKLDVDDEQKHALQQAHHKYRSELHAMATERKSLNAVLAAAAAPGKSDSIKKVLCTPTMQLWACPWLALLCNARGVVLQGLLPLFLLEHCEFSFAHIEGSF